MNYISAWPSSGWRPVVAVFSFCFFGLLYFALKRPRKKKVSPKRKKNVARRDKVHKVLNIMALGGFGSSAILVLVLSAISPVAARCHSHHQGVWQFNDRTICVRACVALECGLTQIWHFMRLKLTQRGRLWNWYKAVNIECIFCVKTDNIVVLTKSCFYGTLIDIAHEKQQPKIKEYWWGQQIAVNLHTGKIVLLFSCLFWHKNFHLMY